MLAFVGLMTISYIGASPPTDGELPFMNEPFLRTIYVGIARQIFGLCLSYLLYIMILPNPNTSISLWRPTCYMRSLLSSNIWVPIATLSYSLYLWHIHFQVSAKTDQSELIKNIKTDKNCSGII